MFDIEEKTRKNCSRYISAAHIIDTGALIGIRQTRFFEGEYKITGDDVLEGRTFDDSIIKIYNNNVYNNWGTGILFGIFGADKPRYRIDVFNNTVKRNGHGNPEIEYKDEYFWITGGLCLLSAQLTDCRIYNNIFENNKGFDIGYSGRYCKNGRDITAALAEKKIEIFDNLVIKNDSQAPQYPITTNYENSILYGLD